MQNKKKFDVFNLSSYLVLLAILVIFGIFVTTACFFGGGGGTDLCGPAGLLFLDGPAGADEAAVVGIGGGGGGAVGACCC